MVDKKIIWEDDALITIRLLSIRMKDQEPYMNARWVIEQRLEEMYYPIIDVEHVYSLEQTLEGTEILIRDIITKNFLSIRDEEVITIRFQDLANYLGRFFRLIHIYICIGNEPNYKESYIINLAERILEHKSRDYFHWAIDLAINIYNFRQYHRPMINMAELVDLTICQPYELSALIEHFHNRLTIKIFFVICQEFKRERKWFETKYRQKTPCGLIDMFIDPLFNSLNVAYLMIE